MVVEAIFDLMQVKTTVTEVIRDRQFRGAIDFGSRPFALIVTFHVSIDRLDEELDARNITSAVDVPKVIQIELQDAHGKPMELAQDEYSLMFFLVAEPCIELHNSNLVASLTREFEVPDQLIPLRFRKSA